MLLHRLRTIGAYLTGTVFCVWAYLFCRGFQIGGPLRCYRWPLLQSGDGVLHIGRGVVLGKVKLILAKGGELRIGDGVGINDGAIVGVLSGVTIGRNTAIAENVMIRDHDHDLFSVPIGAKGNGYIVSDISIGEGCWLGFGAVVLKGVDLGDGVVVGANTVVTKAIPTGAVVVGCPGRVVKTRSMVDA